MRENILTNLQTEMIAGILTPTSTCKAIYRGIYLWEDCLKKPALVLACTGDRIDNNMGGYLVRYLQLYFYGYTNNVESIHSLAYELEDFLYNTYSDHRNLFLGDFELLEGMPLKENNLIRQSLFTMEAELKYDFTN